MLKNGDRDTATLALNTTSRSAQPRTLYLVQSFTPSRKGRHRRPKGPIICIAIYSPDYQNWDMQESPTHHMTSLPYHFAYL